MHIIHANGVCLRSEESEGEARECWRQKSKRRKCCGSQWRDPPDLEFVFCVRRSSPAEGALATGAELSLPKAKNATLRLMVPMTPADPTSNLTNPFLLSGVNPEPTVVFFVFFCFVRADHERRRDPGVRREGLDQAIPGAD